MKRNEEILEILEAFDLTGSYRAAAELAGCDHHTVARYVALRDAGQPPVAREHRARPIDEYLDKIKELVVRSDGRVRADVVHERITAMGFTGGERTTRRTVAEVKARLRAGQRRVFRPWVVEPGLWLQWDWGEGPRVAGRRTNLWCAWLAWSRFRVVLAVWDRTLPTIVACMDTTLRRLGGVPTYALTDNEHTVSVDHVAGIAVRHPEIVAVGRHYGMTIRTCVPADPQSKGGSEATVRIAKADLVPTAANLLEEYRTFAQLETACREFREQVNTRPHRETRRPPVEALAEERRTRRPGSWWWRRLCWTSRRRGCCLPGRSRTPRTWPCSRRGTCCSHGCCSTGPTNRSRRCSPSSRPARCAATRGRSRWRSASRCCSRR